MKWNWGKGIAAAIIFFVLLWLALIIFAFNQKVDLVTPNYYEEELKYQRQIEKEKNSLSLRTQPKIVLEQGTMKVTFPVAETGKMIQGEIHLYRVSGSQYDKRFPIITDSLGTASIPVRALRKGLWQVKIQWSAAGIAYSFDEKITIQ